MSDYCEAFKISSSTNRFACLENGDDGEDDDGECRTSDSSGSHIITKLHPNDVFLGGIKPCQVYSDAIKEVYSQWDFTTVGNQIKKQQKQSVIDKVKASGGRFLQAGDQKGEWKIMSNKHALDKVHHAIKHQKLTSERAKKRKRHTIDDRQASVSDIAVTDNDVLGGKFPVPQYVKDMIAGVASDYAKQKDKSEKGNIIKDTVREIKKKGQFLVSVKGTDQWVLMEPTQESAKVRALITLYDKHGHWPTESQHVSRPNCALQNPTIPTVAPSNATRKVPEKPPIVPTSDDVLYGNRTKHNKHFKQLISSVKDSYLKEQIRARRGRIVQRVLDEVKTPALKPNTKGRFLRQDKDTGEWHEMRDCDARKKIGQAIRFAIIDEVSDKESFFVAVVAHMAALIYKQSTCLAFQKKFKQLVAKCKNDQQTTAPKELITRTFKTLRFQSTIEKAFCNAIKIKSKSDYNHLLLLNTNIESIVGKIEYTVLSMLDALAHRHVPYFASMEYSHTTFSKQPSQFTGMMTVLARCHKHFQKFPNNGCELLQREIYYFAKYFWPKLTRRASSDHIWSVCAAFQVMRCDLRVCPSTQGVYTTLPIITALLPAGVLYHSVTMSFEFFIIYKHVLKKVIKVTRQRPSRMESGKRSQSSRSLACIAMVL